MNTHIIVVVILVSISLLLINQYYSRMIQENMKSLSSDPYKRQKFDSGHGTTDGITRRQIGEITDDIRKVIHETVENSNTTLSSDPNMITSQEYERKGERANRNNKCIKYNTQINSSSIDNLNQSSGKGTTSNWLQSPEGSDNNKFNGDNPLNSVQCQKLCNNDPKCAFYEFHLGDDGTQCKFFSNIKGYRSDTETTETTKNTKNYISGLSNCNAVDNTSCFIHNVHPHPEGYGDKNAGVNTLIYYKDTATNLNFKNELDLGMQKPADGVYGASDVQSSSPQDCQQLCQGAENCSHFAWKGDSVDGGQKNHCWLFNKLGDGSIGKAVVSSSHFDGLVTGPKFCGTNDMDTWKYHKENGFIQDSTTKYSSKATVKYQNKPVIIKDTQNIIDCHRHCRKHPSSVAANYNPECSVCICKDQDINQAKTQQNFLNPQEISDIQENKTLYSEHELNILQADGLSCPKNKWQITSK